MTLPGLPPPRRQTLPVPPGGAAAARAAGRRRAGRGLVTLAVVGAVAVAAPLLARSGAGGDTLQQLAGGGSEQSPPPPAQQTGVAVDEAGRPLASIAVLRSDLTAVLTRTGPDGTWTAPCGTGLLLAAYAPTTRAGVVRERSPGAGNHAWRRLPEHCGESVRTVLPVGAALTGHGRPGQDIRVQRVRGGTEQVDPLGPVFVTRVQPDGSWRVEGLDTGRYLLAGGRTVDVREGQTYAVS